MTIFLENTKYNNNNNLLIAIKNRKIKDWFYEFNHGHPFLLSEETDIICETRFDEKNKWMSDTQIQKLIKFRVKTMYKRKYPNSKKWSLFIF